MCVRAVRHRLAQQRPTHLTIALFPEFVTSFSQVSGVSSSVARDVARMASIVCASV